MTKEHFLRDFYPQISAKPELFKAPANLQWTEHMFPIKIQICLSHSSGIKTGIADQTHFNIIRKRKEGAERPGVAGSAADDTD